MDKINLNKTVYEKRQYTKIIDTSFKELVAPIIIPPEVPVVDQVSEFFAQYQKLFFDIPKLGDINSHAYLIKTSSEFADYKFIDDGAKALLDEVTVLRNENLQLQLQLVNTIKSTIPKVPT